MSDDPPVGRRTDDEAQSDVEGAAAQPEEHEDAAAETEAEAHDRASAEVEPGAATGLGDLLGIGGPRQRWYRALLVPLLAVVSALLVGAIIVGIGGKNPISVYSALLSGAFGSPRQIVSAIGSGDRFAIARSFNPLSETVVTAAPLILAGLSVSLGFRSGLFNIGAQGQIVAGGILASLAGFSFASLPGPIHLALIVAAGFAGGAVWGAIPGFLKARTGAHEVITTIMLNQIAPLLAGYVLTTQVYLPSGSNVGPVAKPVTAFYPHLFPNTSLRINWSIFVALGLAVFVAWLLNRTTIGFEFRTVGANPEAARTAGMSPTRTFVVVMALAGGLAGVAGANQLASLTPSFTSGLLQNVGFDAIAVALLGRSRPGGVVAAAFLFGALRAGAPNMQLSTQIPADLITVIQALVILFVAAPALVRAIYRIRARRLVGPQAFTKGWG